jgi:hypothetical protein
VTEVILVSETSKEIQVTPTKFGRTATWQQGEVKISVDYLDRLALLIFRATLAGIPVVRVFRRDEVHTPDSEFVQLGTDDTQLTFSVGIGPGSFRVPHSLLQEMITKASGS